MILTTRLRQHHQHEEERRHLEEPVAEAEAKAKAVAEEEEEEEEKEASAHSLGRHYSRAAVLRPRMPPHKVVHQTCPTVTAVGPKC
jgi:hypothetical protein